MAQPHPHVAAALAAIQADFRNPEKLTPQERQRRGLGGGDTGVTYAYRGIEQIEGEVQRLCGEHGVVICPTGVRDVTIREISINNRPWTDTTIRVTWRVMGPGGLADSFDGESIGWGRDNADKGYNKAFTSARKNFLLALFHIGDPQDDSDGHTNERDSGTASTPPPPPIDPHREQAIAVYERVKAASDDVKARVQALRAEHGRRVVVDELVDPEWRARVVGVLLAAAAEQAEDRSEGGQLATDAPDPGASVGNAPVPPSLPLDDAGPFPASERDRLAEWMKADPANVARFHSACVTIGLARQGQRRIVKSLTDTEVEQVLTHLFPPDGTF